MIVIEASGGWVVICKLLTITFYSWYLVYRMLISKVSLSYYNDVIMSMMASQITSLTIVHSAVYSRRRSKKTSKLRVTGLCARNSPVTGEFPAKTASNAKNVSIWWRHHDKYILFIANCTLIFFLNLCPVHMRVPNQRPLLKTWINYCL